jgi:hypothetical protein
VGLWRRDGNLVQVELVVAMVTVAFVRLSTTWSSEVCLLTYYCCARIVFRSGIEPIVIICGVLEALPHTQDCGWTSEMSVLVRTVRDQ